MAVGTRWLMRLAAIVAIACALLFGAGRAFAASSSDTPTTSTGEPLTAAVASSDSDGNVAVSKDNDSALLDNCDFGINDFSRQNKGTNKTYNNTYYGYRYTMAGSNAFAVIVCNGYMIVYIPSSVENELGLDIQSSSFQSDFLTTLETIDKAAANGGQRFSTLDETVYFTDEDTVVVGEYTYRFGFELESGYYYASVTQAGSEDGRSGALYAETGNLVAASDTVIVQKSTGLAALQEFFDDLDWSPLWVSLRTTGVATLVIFILGLFAAWWTVRVSDKFKGVLDTIFTIPMVLPPTVCGFLLLMFFGTSTPTGRWFIAHGLDIVFSWPAAVIACIVVGFPLMYRTVRGAFENLDVSMLDAARTLGWSEGRIFSRLMLPLAWPSIAAGTVLAFARAMGEFGCTLFFAGNYVGITQTIPIAIYFDWMAGDTDVAIFWVIVVIIVSFLVILFINLYSSHTQKYKKRLGE